MFPPFKAAVAAGARSVMVSYNEFDGTPCHSSAPLLKDILRGKWGFDGFVVSDLGGIEMLKMHGLAADDKQATEKAFLAGVDADLGGRAFVNLIQLVREKRVSEKEIDKSLRRVLRSKFEIGLFDQPFVKEVPLPKALLAEHRALARRLAAESIVLLKNEDGLLPLKKNLKSIAVIGPNADNVYNMLGDYTAPQKVGQVVTVLEGIRNHVSPQTEVRYAKGCAIRNESEAGFEEALQAARLSEVVVMVMGGSSARDFSSNFETTGAVKVSDDIRSDMECGEGSDRATLHLLGKQIKLMQEVKKLGKPIVLVLIKGRPLIIEWESKNIASIIDAWYPGMEGGNGVADVLFGDYNPAGRLTYSVARSVGQLPVFYNTKPAHNRKKYVDLSSEPLYAFGHGLSYTTFEYSNLSVAHQQDKAEVKTVVSVKVKNGGKVDGDEVVQLYLHQRTTSRTTPVKRLVGFERVAIKAGEVVDVSFQLDKGMYAIHQGGGRWAIESGTVDLMVGSSSDKILLQATIELK